VLVPHLLATAEKPTEVTAAAMAALRAHRWPGNVRELRNVLVTAAIQAQGGPIDARHLLRLMPLGPKSTKRKTTFVPRTLAQNEADGITTLEAVGTKTEAARVLDITRTTLREKLAPMPSDKPSEANGLSGNRKTLIQVIHNNAKLPARCRMFLKDNQCLSTWVDKTALTSPCGWGRSRGPVTTTFRCFCGVSRKGEIAHCIQDHCMGVVVVRCSPCPRGLWDGPSQPGAVCQGWGAA